MKNNLDFPFSRPQLLDLSRNQLNGFDEVFVAKLQQIKDVRLENNPLICDRCRMGFLIDVARTVSENNCDPTPFRHSLF